MRGSHCRFSHDPAAVSGAKRPGACWGFQDKGLCNWGDECVFSHDQVGDGDGGGKEQKENKEISSSKRKIDKVE